MPVDQDWREALPLEKQLLLCCAHTRLDEPHRAHLEELLARDVKWDALLADAAHQHVEPLLYQSLRLVPDGLVPPAVLENCQQIARKVAALSFLYFAELVRIAECFAAEGVPLIPYKGPVLAWLAYGDLTCRRFVDLDFFTEQKYIPRATVLLEACGYQPNFGAEEERAGAAGYAPGQYSFTHSGAHLQVEVHSERTLRYFPRPLDFASMSPRIIEVHAAGRMLRTFSIEDTLVMVCVHGTKHLWERLSWVVDVAELVSAQNINWPQALDVAAKVECTRPLLLGLLLAQEWLDAPVSPEVLQKARAIASVTRLARQLRENLSPPGAAQLGVVRRAQFRFALREGTWQGIRHMARLSLAATESDHEKVRLPRALAPLYLLVRPWRLIQEYGVGLARRRKNGK